MTADPLLLADVRASLDHKIATAVQAVVELDHQLRHAREHLAELQRLRRAAAPAEHQPELEPST